LQYLAAMTTLFLAVVQVWLILFNSFAADDRFSGSLKYSCLGVTVIRQSIIPRLWVCVFCSPYYINFSVL
jgi:hypothetical protein